MSSMLGGHPPGGPAPPQQLMGAGQPISAAGGGLPPPNPQIPTLAGAPGGGQLQPQVGQPLMAGAVPPHVVSKGKKSRGRAIQIIDPSTGQEVQAYDENKKTETTPVIMTDPADQQKEVNSK